MSRGAISERESGKECEVEIEKFSYAFECFVKKPSSHFQVYVKQTESQGRHGVLGTIYLWMGLKALRTDSHSIHPCTCLLKDNCIMGDFRN